MSDIFVNMHGQQTSHNLIPLEIGNDEKVYPLSGFNGKMRN